MILIFGGTTEGRIAIQTLEEAGKTFYYSTKGDEQDVLLHNGIRLQGAMDAIEIETFCAQHHIKLLIDAAHPFATQLHETLEQVSVESNIPVIRFERIFPKRDEEHITWCRDYDDAIEKIQKEKIFILLALTGVQTIGKLKPLWQNACCYFRILDRDSSRKLAREQGFSEKNLYYYTPGEDEQVLMKQLHPEAILLKESGISGGFCEKVEAARQLGIRIFAICRPKTSDKFICVNGEHGLRRIIEKHLPDFFPLRSGLTTGTCAAAAAVAATWDVFNIYFKKRPTEFPVVLPNGETIQVPVEPQHHIPHSDLLENGDGMFETSATVIKDAGDDPDITNGMKVVANIAIPFRIDDPLPEDTPQDDYNIIVCGGEGVGVFNIYFKKRPTEFPVVLPNGETIQVPVEPQHHIPHSDLLENGDGMFETSATVIKDAGDDPDITNGMKVVANIAIPFRIDDPLPEDTPQDDYNIIVCGGEGVGVVTMPGLGLELGSSAINDTPREMIKKNVKLWLERLHIAKQPNPILITISIPGGEEIAKRTFNPRLGIEGGISIIGTSGIVKPFSSEAFINSIRKSMEVAKATRNPRIVISSGAKSERFIKAYYPDLPAQAFVHYGNFIGETLKIAAEEQVPHVTLGVMMGKAVKLAEGNLDTHSKKVTMNKEFIQDLARQTGCSEETLAAIGQMNLARELWDIIPEELLEKFGKALIELCHRHCDPLLPNGELTVLLITENGKIYS